MILWLQRDLHGFRSRAAARRTTASGRTARRGVAWRGPLPLPADWAWAGKNSCRRLPGSASFGVRRAKVFGVSKSLEESKPAPSASAAEPSSSRPAEHSRAPRACCEGAAGPAPRSKRGAWRRNAPLRQSINRSCHI